MKKLVAVLLAGTALLLCCSCGATLNSLQQAVRQVQKSEQTPDSEQFIYPELPSAEIEDNEQQDAEEPDDGAFDEYVDTEGLIGRQFRLSREEAEGTLGFVRQEDGTSAKASTLLGREAVVSLGFNLGGKNNYVEYDYEGSTEIGSRQVISEFDKLYQIISARYEKATVHNWALSQTNSFAALSDMGEFDEAEIEAAINGRETAVFQYAWSRVGNNAAYIYLKVHDTAYSIGFIYDSTQQSGLREAIRA
ncbi:MAG: hypothetical protein VB082_08970 [Christensenella sp.]|nr:hypothetical protein [Christensenella sp.]